MAARFAPWLSPRMDGPCCRPARTPPLCFDRWRRRAPRSTSRPRTPIGSGAGWPATTRRPPIAPPGTWRGNRLSPCPSCGSTFVPCRHPIRRRWPNSSPISTPMSLPSARRFREAEETAVHGGTHAARGLGRQAHAGSPQAHRRTTGPTAPASNPGGRTAPAAGRASVGMDEGACGGGFAQAFGRWQSEASDHERCQVCSRSPEPPLSAEIRCQSWGMRPSQTSRSHSSSSGQPMAQVPKSAMY